MQNLFHLNLNTDSRINGNVGHIYFLGRYILFSIWLPSNSQFLEQYIVD
jgi:hypothetical protein